MRFARGGADQVDEEIDLVVRMHVLQHRRETLEAHAGVDAGRGQRRQVPLVVAIELHEHEIPDLDVAVAVCVGRPRRSAKNFRTVVVEDFRARSAGAGVGHLPEVVARVLGALVVADAHDTLDRDADFLRPDVVGLVVVDVHGGPQFFRRQPVDVRQQLPRVMDRLALEVVAERPVAEHLEERVVTRRVADVLQVVVLAAGAQAPLDGDGAHVASLFGAEEHVLELDHARVGEQQRRVVGRDERRARDERVPVGDEKVDEFAADFGDLHRGSSGGPLRLERGKTGQGIKSLDFNPISVPCRAMHCARRRERRPKRSATNRPPATPAARSTRNATDRP